MSGHHTSDPGLEVSLVMPCLNEARTLPTCIRKAQSAIAKHGLRAEIVVADNGSTDGSDRIARECGARVVAVEERGYGAAVMGGVAAARGTYVVMGDADDSYDWSSIATFVERLREGYDLVMGCRLPSGGGTVRAGAMPFAHRWLGNPTLTWLSRLFFRCPISDIYCGLRAFRRDLCERLGLAMIGMEFACEMVIKATLAGQRITEVPITLYPDGRVRRSHLRTWRDGWLTLRFMLLFSPRWLFLIPGCILFVVGLVVGAVLVAGPIRVGTVVFDVSTLLVCGMAVLIGFQLIAFALFTKVYAVSRGLLPRDATLDRLLGVVTLEGGLVIGGGLSLVGLGLLLWAVDYWRAFGFGPLSYPKSLRLSIPAVIMSTLGIEMMFSSFFLGILGLRRR
ncbi:MAG: glycosyltransferase family 2 protein [Proteobacteria bacterium]|nr:glycosyltransferase family 2 protein [Pseudomonadota bacterium]